MWSSKQRWSAAGLIFIGVVAGVIFASSFNMPTSSLADKPKKALPTFDAPLDLPVITSVQETGKAFTAVAKALLPAVVHIQSTIAAENVSQGRNQQVPEAFRDLFRQQAPQPQRGAGSGVIVSKDGYILTNHHVINEAENIRVTLYDNREFDAELVGTDPLTEVAVIKIKGNDFPTAPLGDSEIMEVGEWVLAFGSPLGLSSSVTAGIISAKSRNINIIRDENAEQTGGSWAIENFIQTDAAINRGNSGGPLVNMKGHVIGINTAIATGTGYNVGAGFAIPVNLAKRIMRDIIDKGYVARPWMGISMSAQPVTANQAEYYGMDRPTGVFVQDVVNDGPADKAGVRTGDIILQLDGKEVDQSNQVQNLVALKNPDDVVTLTILRRGEKQMTIRVKLEEREIAGQPAAREAAEEFSELGLTVTDLDNDIRRTIPAYRDEEGVVVTDVEIYSIAFDENIRRSDLILEIENQKVRSVREYRQVLRSFQKGQVVVFKMKRGTNEYQAFIKLPNN